MILDQDRDDMREQAEERRQEQVEACIHPSEGLLN